MLLISCILIQLNLSEAVQTVFFVLPVGKSTLSWFHYDFQT